MAALGLQEHVQGPTHKMGNTLDLIFSQLEMQLTVTGKSSMVVRSLHGINRALTKKSIPPIVRKVMRDYSKVTPHNFIENYITPNYSPSTTLDEVYHLFKEELLKAINQKAPLKTIKCSERKKHPWHNKFIKEQKRVVKTGKKHGENTNKIISGMHTQRKGTYTIGYSPITKTNTVKKTRLKQGHLKTV